MKVGGGLVRGGCRKGGASSGVKFTSPMPPRSAVSAISEAIGLVEASLASCEP